MAIFSSTMSKSPVLPLFAKALGATSSTVGLIAAASTVVGIVASAPAGVLSDVLGRRRVILFAVFIFASAPFFYLPIVGTWHLILVRAYHGLATAIFGPVAMASVADLYVAQRGEKMGWYSSATLVGRSAAPFVGGVLLSLASGSGMWRYRIVYLVCGTAGVLAFVLALKLPVREGVPFDAEGGLDRVLSGLSTVIRHRGILFTGVAEAAQLFGYGAYEVFLPLYAMSVGISTSLIGILLGAKVLTLTSSKPLMGRLSDRYGRRGQIVAGLIVGALSLGAIPFLRSFWALLVLSLLLGSSMAAVTASTAALVSDMAEGAYGSALGVMSTIMDVGHASGPIATGYLIGAMGYRGGYPVVGGVLLSVALLFPIMVPKPVRGERR